MDYAKYTYLKLAELEDNQSADNSAINSVEFENMNINTDVLSSHKFGAGAIFTYGKVNFQNKVLLSATQSVNVKVELLVDDIVISQEERELDIGQTAVLLMKSFSSSYNGTINISVKVTVLDNGKSVKVLSNMLTAWGQLKEDYSINECSMQAITVGANLLISYIQDGKIYFLTSSAQASEFSQKDFTYVANGLSYSFAEHKSTGDIYFYRVDYNGNLFYSKVANLMTEELIDTNVTSVYAKKCANSYTEDILICYVKNGKPMYCTMTGSSVASSGVLDAPKDTYRDVYIADSFTDRMFVVCTTKKNKNYILFTQKDTNLSAFYTSLDANIAFFVTKYLYFDANNDIFEQINADIHFTLSKYLLEYQNLLENRLSEHINSNILFLSNSYVIDTNPEVNYYMSFTQTDTSSPVLSRITYSGDCADWTFAYFDLKGTGALVDSGNLLSKWPFNKIKPCLVSNGQFVCYLNPNNFALKEDGTPADITSGTYDVMIEFPKVYIKFEEDWDGVCSYYNTKRADISISVSNVAKAGYSCLSHTKQGVEYDSIYVSAYKSQIKNGTIYSCSGKIANSDVTHKQFVENFASYKGSSYSTFNYHFLTYLRVLQMLLFGETRGVDMFGYGWLSGASVTDLDNGDNFFDPTGVMNTSGMYNCIMAPQEGASAYTPPSNAIYHNKIFGLEDIFGGSKTYMDGILFTSNRSYLVMDPTNANSTINFAGTGYDEYKFSFSGTYLNGWVTMYTVNNSYGMLPVHYTATHQIGRSYYGVRTKVYQPNRYSYSDATNSFTNMIFTVGGDYKGYCGLEMWADLEYNNQNQKHNERLICYPLSKISS